MFWLDLTHKTETDIVFLMQVKIGVWCGEG